ncbi:MAG: hypothetical protein IPP29_25070 [Bacteroidetes bacterium]|nr:hypothetical protein [Bacteroidota bacterium]
MKSLTFIFCFCLCLNLSFSQTTYLTQANLYKENVRQLTVNNDGCVLYSNNEYGDKSFRIAQLDNSGNVVWRKNFNTTQSDNIGDAIVLSNNHHVVTGSTVFNATHGYSLFVSEIDENGNVVWANKYLSNYHVLGVSIVKYGNFYYVLGNIQNTELALLKLDLLGNIVFAKTLKQTGVNLESCKLLTMKNSSDIIIVATRSVAANFQTNLLSMIRCNNGGNIIWSKFYMYTGIVRDVVIDLQNNILYQQLIRRKVPAFLSSIKMAY